MEYTAAADTEATTKSVSQPKQPVETGETIAIESQVGQLFMIGHWADTPVASTTKLIEQYELGGVVIMSAPENPAEILSWSEEWNAVSDTPLLIAIDQEGGPVSRLQTDSFVQTGQKSITSTEHAYTVGLERGRELSDLGINLNFAPVLDSAANPDSFLYQRVFPENTSASDLAGAMIRGMEENGVTAVIKHFPGHDDTNEDSHYLLPKVHIPLDELDTFTTDFRETISSGQVQALMTAHVQFSNIDPLPATLSQFFLTDYLRNTLRFDGIVITDDMTMDAIDSDFQTTQASQLAVEAGANILLFAAEPEMVHQTLPFILEQSQTSGLLRSQIERSYQRVSRLKNTI